MDAIEYYNHPYVSNSELTRIKKATLAPREQIEYTAALRRGSLLDAYVTWGHIDPKRYYDMVPSPGEHDQVKKLYNALMNNQWYKQLDKTMIKQWPMFRENMALEYMGVRFSLNFKCLFDFFQEGVGCLSFMGTLGDILPFGGDLKRTSARTEAQFLAHCDLFDYDRSRALYMDIAQTDKDFILAVNEQGNIFSKFIRRGDAFYCSGREKYTELSYKKWALSA